MAIDKTRLDLQVIYEAQGYKAQLDQLDIKALWEELDSLSEAE